MLAQDLQVVIVRVLSRMGVAWPEPKAQEGHVQLPLHADRRVMAIPLNIMGTQLMQDDRRGLCKSSELLHPSSQHRE